MNFSQTCTQFHQVGVYIGCASSGATCHISDSMVVSSFKRQTDSTKIRIQCSYGHIWSIQVALPVAVMATELPNAFSRKTLFLLKSCVDLIQACTQCSPGRSVHRVFSKWRHLSCFRFHGRFQVALCTKHYFFTNNL